jgi:hypothetical protein
MAKVEISDEYKYARTGYVDQGRKSDHILATFLANLPGDGRLPLRWHHRSVEAFQKRHGHLGTVLWAPASNSHLLLVAGQKVLRVWMDSANHCYVDLNAGIAASLATATFAKVEDIPAGNVRKCKPFTQRIRIWQNFHAAALIDAVKRVYGLDHQRLSVRMWT